MASVSEISANTRKDKSRFFAHHLELKAFAASFALNDRGFLVTNLGDRTTEAAEKAMSNPLRCTAAAVMR
jgi:hypothetical protein